MVDVFLVRQGLRPDRADEVASFVTTFVGEREAEAPATLLPGPGASTVSVFLERGSFGPAVWWFVELDGPAAGRWEEPAAAVRESPIFEAGLDDLLDGTPDRVYGPQAPGGPLVLHARNHERPASFRTDEGRSQPTGQFAPAVLLADDGPTDPPDVVMTRFWLRRGPASWFGRALGWLIQWVDEEGWLERRFQEWSEPVLEEEAMWAETFFFERGREGTVILYWMECDDLDGVRDGFYATSSAVARVSEVVMGWIFEEPERALVPGKFTTDFDALVHAVASDRT